MRLVLINPFGQKFPTDVDFVDHLIRITPSEHMKYWEVVCSEIIRAIDLYPVKELLKVLNISNDEASEFYRYPVVWHGSDSIFMLIKLSLYGCYDRPITAENFDRLKRITLDGFKNYDEFGPTRHEHHIRTLKLMYGCMIELTVLLTSIFKSKKE